MKSKGMSGKKCLIVLGMHRSGTSATMGVLNKLGVSISTEQLPANFCNEKGFFEQIEMILINERILAGAKSRWDDFGQMDPGTIVLGDEAHAMAVLISREKASADLFGFKDPRLTRLLPLWVRALKAQGVDVACVIPLRNPHEIISSLVKRDGFSMTKSLMLWATSMFDAELYSRDIPRVFIKYDDLLDDASATIGRIEASLGMKFPFSYGDKKDELDEFLDPGLRHHRADKAAWDNITLPGLRDLWKALEQADEAPKKDAKKIQGKIDEIRKVYFEELKDVVTSAVSKSSVVFKDQIALKDSRINEMQNTFSEISSATEGLKAAIAAKDTAIADGARVVEDLRAQLAARTAEKDASIVEGARVAEDLRAQLAARDTLIAEKDASIAEMARVAEALNAAIVARDASIAEGVRLAEYLRAQISAKDALVAEKETIIAEMAQVVDGLKAALEDKKHSQNIITEALNEKDALVREQKLYIAEKQKAIKEIASAMDRKDTLIESLKENMEGLKGEVIVRDEAIAERAEALSRIYKSRGWKALSLYYKLRDIPLSFFR